MKNIVVDPELVGHCGLYCGACGAHLKERCPGCAGNEKATWCKVRTCCKEKGCATCAGCDTYDDVKECAKFHNFISRIIGFVLRSDRAACIARIRDVGAQAYAAEMTEKRTQRMRPGEYTSEQRP